MHGLGDELFARAGLALDEDGEVGRSALLQAPEQVTHERARSVERTELLDVRKVDLLRLYGFEREIGPRDGEARRGREVRLADAEVADPRAVLAAEIAKTNAARRGDELGVHRGHSRVA